MVLGDSHYSGGGVDCYGGGLVQMSLPPRVFPLTLLVLPTYPAGRFSNGAPVRMKDTRNTELLATLCTATFLIWSVSFAALFDRDKASPFVLKFYVAFNEGADCPRLFELRNNAKRQGADHEQQKTMNDKLRSVGCYGDMSKRAKP